MNTPAITDLVLERQAQVAKGIVSPTVAVTPPITEDYWSHRVRVADGQAVVAFPKFFTVGIGFAAEEDWNTNLPYTSDARQIAQHIWHNRSPLPDDAPSFELVVAAIELLQSAIAEDLGGEN